MTEYQKERVRAGKTFVDDYKQSTPCADCAQVSGSWGAYLMVRPESTYRKPISQLVSGGASLRRLTEAIAERDLVCLKCYATRRRDSMADRWSELPKAETPSPIPALINANKRRHDEAIKQHAERAPQKYWTRKNLYNQPGAVELYADRGMVIATNGAITDAETGLPLNEDERARRILAGNNWRSAPTATTAAVPFTAQPDLLGERLAEFESLRDSPGKDYV